jgi:molybdopterin-binding protein
MNQRNTLLKLMISGAVVAAIGLAASAQTTTTSTATASSAGNLTSAAGKTKPTSATAQMIQEACQRRKARAAKLQQSGIPERFGSEEPFTFDPNAPCS